MTVLEDILSQEIIQKLGWTLVHFIWQAAVVASLLAILLRVLRKSTANLRYIFACLALGLIVLLPVITIQLVPVSVPHPAAHIEPVPAPTVLATEGMPAAETIIVEEPVQSESIALVSADSWKQRTIEVFEPALPYIVSGWLVGVFGLSVWHLGGWAQLQRLKRRMVKQVDYTLGSKLKVLAQRLRVKQTVQLMESALVQIPTVIGWLRPVILLPASALTGLNSEQLEAILAHELAHIRRCDYLLNILQTIVEILGFYHPAVWWVSHKIRAERENCCDDLAVSISGDRVCYARALTSMEEIRTGQGQLAVAASGGNLFRRIYRLLGKDSAEKTGFSWIPAATAILLILALVIPTALAFTTKSDSQQPDSKIDVHVENHRSGESQHEKEPSVDDILTVLPTIAKSPTPSAQDKTIIQVDCLVVEVFTDLKMDRETTIVAENILGNKVSLRDSKVDVILRKAAEATAATKDKSAENKRVPQDQFKALVDMLTSKGYLRILMNPRIQVVDGKTAKIMSAQKISSTQGGIEDSIQITPHVFADGHITLQVEAAISSKSIPKGVEQIPIITTREVSTLVRTSPGESLIIGGLKETGKSSETDSNVKDTKEQATEVLFILTTTIITPATDSQEKTDVRIKGKSTESADKLKWLGLAVAMYANDHEDNLPQNLQQLKPYLQNEQDFDWLLDNAEYFGSGKSTRSNAAFIPIAYDKSLFIETDATNVLFLDFSVRFLDAKEFEKLDIKRAEFLIEAWFLAVSKDFLQNINHNANPPDEAEVFFILTSELLAASGGWKTQSFIIDERNVSLVLEAVQAHKDFKVLSSPQLICQEDKTAQIRVLNNETYSVTSYNEPNRPSEKSDPKFDKVEEGISLSVTPKLTPNKNIDMQLEFEITQFLEFEERKLKGKAPKVEKITQALRYIAKDGQAFLFGGHKIADHQDGRTEQKDLLVLIRAQTIGSPEQDRSIQAKDMILAEPGKTTTNVIMQPGIVQGRIITPNENEREKTRAATEQKPQMVQKLFNLTHHNSSQMAQIVRPLLTKTGHISADERTNNLLVIDTLENLMRIEKIIAEFDAPRVEQTVTEIFEIRYGDPAEIVKSLRMLISGQTGTVSSTSVMIGPSKQPVVLIPEPSRKWIIAKASAEDMKQIGQWIEKLDREEPIPASLLQAEKLKGLIETGKRVDSARKLSNLGHALLIYANDHEDKYPDSLHELRGYLKTEDFAWTRQNVEYLAHGKTVSVRPDTVIAYDKTLLTKGKGTNVLFNDSHIEFVKSERLKELGISATEIQIETRILLVSEDFLQSIGLDANSVHSSDAWSEHLLANSIAEPKPTTYSLILDDLHISFLLKAVGANKGATVLAAPQVMTQEGKTAEIGVMTEEYYVLGYTEPNQPSDKPVPKTDKVELGTRIWLKPELTPDNKNVRLDFKMEFRQLLGYEERKYKDKYIYLVPRTEVVSTEMPCLIPDGKTLLIVGQKITDKVSAAPILSKLPVVGELFRSRDKTKDQRILLILVKPIINPQQKASKILPGQADSEEHIKHLANQLEKKLNPSAEPK